MHGQNISQIFAKHIVVQSHVELQILSLTISILKFNSH